MPTQNDLILLHKWANDRFIVDIAVNSDINRCTADSLIKHEWMDIDTKIFRIDTTHFHLRGAKSSKLRFLLWEVKSVNHPTNFVSYEKNF